MNPYMTKFILYIKTRMHAKVSAWWPGNEKINALSGQNKLFSVSYN